MDPGPHETHNHLIESVHRAIRTHPAPEAKANYAKMLATLLQQQAKTHAAAQTANQHSVGSVSPVPQRPGPPEGIYGDGQVGPPPIVTAPPIDRGHLGLGPYPDTPGFAPPPFRVPPPMWNGPPVRFLPPLPGVGAAVAAQLHHVPLPAWA